MITDHNIGWVRARKWYGIGELLTGLTTPATGTITAGEGIQPAAGTVGDSPEMILGEVSTFGITGLQVTADIADKLAFILRPPGDIDPGKPVGFRICFTASAVASAGRSTLFIPTFKTVVAGTSVVTIASVTVNLNTLIAAKLNTGANALEWTSRGIRNNFFGLTRKEIEDGAMLQGALDITYANAPGTVTMFGMEMDYAILSTLGQGSLVDQPVQQDGVA